MPFCLYRAKIRFAVLTWGVVCGQAAPERKVPDRPQHGLACNPQDQECKSEVGAGALFTDVRKAGE